MKTAISVPDDVYAKVEQRARTLGMTRSQFYSNAARNYLDHLDAESLTRRIDSVVDLVGMEDSNTAAVAAGRRLLGSADDDW